MTEADERLNKLLQSGVVTLTGGRDIHKNLILTIPTDKLPLVEGWTVQDLTYLFMCLASISKYLQTTEASAKPSSAGPRLACVCDLSSASSSCIKQLVDTLEAVEHQQRGTVGSVYFLKPRNKARSHSLKKMLGVKPSKKNPKVPLFKVVLLKTFQELHTQVEISQLTLDFYGRLQYNHQAWMHLYKVVVHCIRSGQRLLSKLPSVRDRVDLLQEYDTDGHTSSQLQQLLADLTEKFQMIHSESGLVVKLQETKQTLFSLDNPGADDQLSSALPKVTEGLRITLRGVYTQLNQQNTELEEAWRDTESKLTLLMQVQKHRERAREIENKICQHYQPLLQEHPIVGRTLSQAELYRAHFTTTLHEPAKELLSQATEILEAVQRLKSSEGLQNVTTALGRRRNSVAPAELVTLDMSDITRCLTTSIQPFTGQLQQLQQIYVNVHIFHLLFEKALSWYKKALKFLPESLLERCATHSGLQPSEVSAYSESSQTREMLLYMPKDWLGAVRVFVSRHPPPRQEHIERLDESTPHVVDKRLRAQARSLALRLRLLQRVLSSNRLPLRLLQAVVAWRAELFGAHASQERPPSAQPGGAVSPLRERQRGVQFSSHIGKFGDQQTDEEVRGQAPLRHAHHRSQPGDGRGGRPKRVPLGPDPHDVFLEGQRNPAHSATADPFLGLAYQGIEVASGPEQGRLHERGHPMHHRRSAGARTMLRSRSVDFNFNSSSTDGSVFDYDKAVLGLREGHGTGEQTAAGPRHHTMGRKHHPRPDRDPVGFAQHSDRLGYGFYTEEQAMSDPSHVIPSDPRSRLSFAMPDKREDLIHNNEESQSYGRGIRNQQAWYPPAEQRDLDHVRQPERAQSAHFPLSSDSSSQERFIRLSLSPRKSGQTGRDEYYFRSDPEQVQADRPILQGGGGREEEESGFDTAEGDPYDSIVIRIREISSSNFTSAEKLQRVSDLISKSQRGDGSQQNAENKSMKSAKSTIDLTREDKHSRRMERVQKEDDDAQSGPRERPVEVIYRMKQNIAKSMEDLSSAPPLSESRYANERFRSELRIDPVFTLPRRSGERTGVGPEELKHSFSDAETSKSSPLLTSPGEGGSRTRTGSDVEASFPHPYRGDGWSHMADGDNEGSTSDQAPRPTSLAIPSSRNFISPSFLRPAMSMQDLSSRPPLTAANLGLLQELDTEPGFGKLGDMEMLQALQGESFVQMQRVAQEKAEGGSHTKEKSNDRSRHLQSSSSFNKKDVGLSEQRNQAATQAAGKDVIANFVLCENGTGPSRKEGSTKVDGILSHYAASGSSGNTSHSWLAARSFLKQGGSFSTEEEMEATSDVLIFQNKINLNRLSLEAQQEYISQEDVAQSLKNTQRILENEEKRQMRRRELASGNDMEEVHPEGNHRENGGLAISTSASVDNGYSSWASRLVSALSTSSEGGDAGARAAQTISVEHEKEDWKSSSSEDTYSHCSQET